MDKSLTDALSKENITFILGAGASKNLGVPLTREFLPLIYYLTYFNQFELEKPSFHDEQKEIFEKMEKSCLDAVNLFSYGIVKNFKNRHLTIDEINRILKYFFDRTKSRVEYDNFCRSITTESVSGLLSSLKNLTRYEEKILISVIERLMFLLGKDSFETYSSAKLKENIDLLNLMPNIENLISYADITSLITRNDGIKNLFDTYDEIYNLNQYSLYHVIGILMHLTNNYQKNPFKGSNKEPYNSLAKFLKRHNAAIITFNYDTLLEQELDDLKVEYDYKINFSNINSQTSGRKFYKLHGSLNWWSCRNCLTKFRHNTTDFETYLSLIDTDAMHWKIKLDCCVQQDLFPIIIPPTMLKYAQDIDLIRLWMEASDDIAKSQTIIIIGYSFPKEDINAINLFKKSILNNSNLKYIIYIGTNSNPVNFLKSFLKDVKLDNKIKLLEFTGDEGFAEKTVPKILEI